MAILNYACKKMAIFQRSEDLLQLYPSFNATFAK